MEATGILSIGRFLSVPYVIGTRSKYFGRLRAVSYRNYAYRYDVGRGTSASFVLG